jgi:molybdopterin-binding protein
MARKLVPDPAGASVRIGRAAEMLGVSVDTVRRWVDAGRLGSTRTGSGQRSVSMADLTRLAAERRKAGETGGSTGAPRASVATSARNRFPGVVTRIEVDRVAAVVEVQAGPHRLVSLMTAEAVQDLGLRVGDAATCVVKATNVVVEVPAPRGRQR